MQVIRAGAILLLILLVVAGAQAVAPVRDGDKFTWNTTDGARMKAVFGAKDRVDVNLSLSKWDGEVGMTLVPQIPAGITFSTISQTAENITVSCPGCSMDIVVSEPGNGFDYSLVLRNKPPSNELKFNLTSSGLVFHYQDELWKERGLPFVDNGTIYACNMTYCNYGAGIVERPMAVVHSYAIYRVDGKTGNQYTTGKFAQLNRSLLIDDRGATSWADLSMSPDRKTLTITADAAWLNAGQRKYPVLVDPDFGYDVIGGSADTKGINTYWALCATAPETGTTTQTVSAIKAGAYACDMRVAIYNENRILNVGNTTAYRPTFAATAQWYTVPIAGSVTASNKYFLTTWINATACAGSYALMYDAISGEFGVWNSTVITYWEGTLKEYSTNSYKYSIYANYTVAGGVAVPITMWNLTSSSGLVSPGGLNATHRNATLTLTFTGVCDSCDAGYPMIYPYGAKAPTWLNSTITTTQNLFPKGPGGYYGVCVMSKNSAGADTKCGKFFVLPWGP